MKSLYFLLLIVVFVSCQKSVDNSATQDNPAQTMPNVAYGSNAAQVMDVYLPAGHSATATKAVVMIHGGAWTTGDKSDFVSDIDTLKKRLPDYAIFNVNYRLAVNGANTFPAQENDIKAAIAFIISKAGEYKFNKDKLVFLGVSSGAHLALLQAYKYPSASVKAVVDFFGPTDMVDMYNHPMNPLVQGVLQSVVGATPTSNPTLYSQSSPINFVTAQAPPTLILHGTLDDLVNVQESIDLNAKLTSLGVTNQLFLYPGEGHGWFGAKLSDSYAKVEAFLKANVL